MKAIMNSSAAPPYNAQFGTPGIRVVVADTGVIGVHTPPMATYPEGHVTVVCNPVGEVVTPFGANREGKFIGREDTVGAGGAGGTPKPAAVASSA